MIDIMIHGSGGTMGKNLAAAIEEDDRVRAVCGIDIKKNGNEKFPVYSDPEESKEHVDVIVDFSVAAAVDGIVDYAVKHRIPIVLCTTGLTGGQLDHLKNASRTIPVLRSANMSLGVNTIISLAVQAAKVLAAAGFDIEIVERHHNNKLDAPSGTALAIADAINAAFDDEYHYKMSRSERAEKRDKHEIGIQSVRGGGIVGEHEVLFCGANEVVEIRHTAYSKGIFAKGAIEAALFLADKEPGMYTMADVIG
ncbi:MAG: 4-hydroxy-tetrahydrodipicolinate reductase [Lachnospiraceae bacterium]|nr:4-hydroxy-tetrahydrodipicolinate reductase [Lachnospiraceae bacterium]